MRILVVCILLPVVFSAATACPSCFGDPDSPMTEGMNAAILFLLGITGVMLILFSVFFLYLRRRWREVNRPFGHLLN